MGRKRTNLEERILNSATNLFYLNGYQNTGIAQIIGHSQTNKASFYQYYKSKNELGHKYLFNFNRSLLRSVIKIMRKAGNADEFCRQWFKLTKYRMKHDINFNGCPLANFVSQIENTSVEDKNYLHSLSRRWIKLLTSYFRIQQEKGHMSNLKSPENLARIFFSIHQGSLVSWKLIRDIKVMDDAYIIISSLLRD